MADAFALANAFVRIRPTTDGFKAEADPKIQAVLRTIDAKVSIGADTKAAQLAVGDLRAKIGILAGRVYNMRLRMDDAGAQAKLATMAATLLKLDKMVVDPKIDVAGIAAAQAALLGVNAQLQRLNMTMGTANIVVGRFTGWWNILNNRTKVPLFGGNSFGWIPRFIVGIGALHVLLDTVLEIAAVLIPATVAMIAFGVAGYDAGKRIVQQFTNMHTVMDANLKAMYPFSGALEKLHKVIEPAVFQLFGDAITVWNQKMSEFATLAKNSAGVIDVLGARIAVALRSGAFSVFLKNAAKDLAGLGDIVGNIFGTIGNFIRQLPGYAQAFLSLGQAITHGLEVVTGTGFAQGVIRFGLWAHGAFLYAGLGATLFAFTMRKALPAASMLLDKMSFGVGKLTIFGKASRVAQAGLADLADTAAGATALPWGWIAAGALLIGILAYKIITAKTATEQWFAATQQFAGAQSAVKGFTLLQTEQTFVTERLFAAQLALADSTDRNTKASEMFARQGASVHAANLADIHDSQDLLSFRKTLIGQTVLYATRMVGLTKIFGSFGVAQGLLLASGVTLNDMLKTGSQAWLMILQRVQATQAAYRAMGQTGGVLGADLNALNLAASDQVAAMQKINQAFDTVLGTISGGQTNFLQFQQALGGVAKDAQAAGASMSGLGPNSLQLRIDFQKSYQAALTLADSLRMMQSMSPGGFPSVGRAIKDMIAEMLPWASQTAAGRDLMISLAQEQNPAISNFRELTKWVGNIQNPGRDLNKLLSSMGGNLRDIAKDARDVAANFQSQLINQFNLAKLGASGVSTAIKTLGTEMGKTHPNAKKMQDDAQTLYNKLVANHIMAPKVANDFVRSLDPAFKNTATAMGDLGAAGQADIFRNAMEKLEKKLQSYVRGSPYQAAITAKAFADSMLTYALAIPHEKTAKGTLEFHAAGGIVGGSGSGDTVPAMLTPGEVVVPKRMVAGGAVDHLRGRLPGFAAGGFVAPGSSGVPQIVPWVSGAEKKFMAAGEKAFATGAIKALIAGVTAAFSGGIRGLRNPLRKMRGLTPERIDMGVDYGGSGSIFAIGGGTISNTMVPGWPGGAFINVKLDASTAYPGKSVYMAEFIAPRVHTGQKVGTNTVIGNATGGGIEAGWAAGASGNALAAAAGQAAGGGDPGARTTAYGDNFNKLMVALGAPSGIHTSPPVGKVGPGFFRPGAGQAGLNASGYLSRTAGINLGRRMAATYGWTGIQWQDLYKLWQAESTWNPHAQNRTSGAAGIPQDISGNFHGGTYGQLRWGMNYIRNRPGYGSPARAWSHEQAFGWYDRGGLLPPGLSLALNTTGRAERVVPAHGKGDPVVVQFRASHGDRYGQFLLNEIQRLVRDQGGGDVQLTFGLR